MADDHKSPLDQALDLFVYAPLGLAFTARDELPQLVEKGRSRLTAQLTMAKMIGQFAVTAGQKEAEKAAARLIEQAEAAAGRLAAIPPSQVRTGGAAQAIRAAEAAKAAERASRAVSSAGTRQPGIGQPGTVQTRTGQTRTGQTRAGQTRAGQTSSGGRAGAAQAATARPAAVAGAAVVAGAAGASSVAVSGRAVSNGAVSNTAASNGAAAPTAAASNGAGADLAIHGYDTLSASQVVQRLAGLSPSELDEIGHYEDTHRGRRTILAKVEQLQTERG